MRISFLIHNVFGVGGTNRAVINLASELTTRHDVEIVSVFRRLDAPMLHIPSRVSVRPLVDLRPESADREDPQQRQRSSIVPGEEEFYAAYSQLTDARLRTYLAESRRDVYIGTRPALNLAVAHWGPPGAVLIAQEHQTHATIPDGLRQAMRTAYVRLDAAITVTGADAEAFRDLTPVPGLRVEAVPNSSPADPLPPADTTGSVLIAAGRLDPVKQYDLLLHAFSSVVDGHPDASLRIYGAGPERDRLRRLVGDLLLEDRVLLMGRHAHLETEWVKGAMLVSSSERESFGMSIVEAMRAGLPVVSTRAPVGPEEIIRDGEDGLLVPVGDVPALASAMASLLDDPARRSEMGRRARENAARFDPARVASQYEQIFESLAGQRHSAITPRRQVTTMARRLLSPLRVRPSRSAQPEGSASVDQLPTVHVVLLDSGELRFTVASDGAEWQRLVLKRRRSDERAEIHLTVDPTDGGMVGALLPSTVMAEGRWDASLETATGELVRAGAGRCDTRRAAAMPLATAGRPLARRLPYETADGFLAVRTWLRSAHAEVDVVERGGATLALRGRVVSEGDDVAGRQVRVIAASRLDGVPEWTSSPTDTDQSGCFEGTVDLDDLSRHRVTRHDDWDLYLEVVDSGTRARLGRLADDIVDRKPMVTYEVTRSRPETDPRLHDEYPLPTVEVRPYFTVNNDLSLYVTER